MTQAYTVPGVSVRETSNPALITGVTTLSRIALIGSATGSQSATQSLILTSTTPVVLAHSGLSLVDALQISETTRSPLVKDSTGVTLDPGNYLIAQSSDPDTSVEGDEIFSITRIPSPTVAPTVLVGTGGTLVGDFQYAVSFVNDRGETGLSPVSAVVSPSTQKVTLSVIPLAPAQTGVAWNSRKIYRKKSITTGGDGLYHEIHTIPDNTTTTYADTGDTALTTIPKTGLASGGTVVVAYQYTDQYYFEPTVFEDFDNLADKYGDPFDSTGAISSQLTFAANIAFSNGADEIMAVATKSSSAADFTTALGKLTGEETAAFIVPISGDPAVGTAAAAHAVAMNTQGFYRMAILGRDGSVTQVPDDDMKSAAVALSNEAVTLVSPDAFGYIGPNGTEMTIGGQYVAAAVAGMYSGRDPQVTLTRKPVASISSVKAKRTESQKQQDSLNGLLVIENKGGVIRVRHGITTAPGNPNTQEGSVVRAKYEMARRLHDVLDRNVIGLVAPLDEIPQIVKGVVTGTLDTIMNEGTISAWANVKARSLIADPTTVEVRFEYTPAYPVNHVDVRFTISTNTGVFEFV